MTDIPGTSDQWGRVEIMGHRTHYGRISEVQRFGATMLQIEIPGAEPDSFEVLYYAGSAIFGIRPCDEETARKGAEMLRPRVYARPAPALIEAETQVEDEPDEDETDAACFLPAWRLREENERLRGVLAGVRVVFKDCYDVCFDSMTVGGVRSTAEPDDNEWLTEYETALAKIDAALNQGVQDAQ
jgi:hypothetical protein